MDNTSTEKVGTVIIQETNLLDYDEILKTIGEFGSYQRLMYLLMCLPIMMSAYSVHLFSFVGFSPQYYCTNRTNDSEDWLNASVCENCNEWTYEPSPFESTLVSEFNLVCNNKWKQTLVGSLYMIGMLSSCIPVGSLSDRFGRKTMFFYLCAWMGCCNLACALAKNYVVYVVFRLLAGAAGSSIFQMAFILGVELVGPRYRTLVGFLAQAIFALGGVLLGAVAFFVRQWRTLQLISAVPYFFFLFYHLVVPESVLWLVSRGEQLKAQKIILKAAAFNGRVVPSHMLLAPKENTENREIAPSTEALNSTLEKSSNSSIGLKDLFISASLKRRLAILIPMWIIAFHGYYGLSMSSANLNGDIFLNYELSMLVEILAVFAGMWVYEKLGRSLALSSSFTLGSAFCFSVALIKGAPIATLALSLLAKIFVVISFSVMYSYTMELFPTPIRSTIMGVCITAGGLGSIAATITTTVETDSPMFLYLILATSQLIAGVGSSILPETAGQTLPATLLEAENLDKHVSFVRRCLARK